MQIKKEEVKTKILCAGLDIFTEVGFERASIRNIVKRADTNIGNFYNYFNSKEALFDALVKDDYEQIIFFLEHHEDEVHENDDLLKSDNLEELTKVLEKQAKILSFAFTQKTLLLIDASEGTKYSGFKQQLTDFFSQHVLEFYQKYQPIKADAYASIISELFIEGMIKIARRDMNTPQLTLNMTKHFMFFTLGTAGLLKDRNLFNTEK